MKSRILILAAALFVPYASFANASISPWEVDAQLPISAADAETRVKNLLATSKIHSKEYFCLKNDLTCRVHYTLEDQDGNPIAPFYVRFIAADRSQAAQGYFFPVAARPGTFIRFEDFTFDGKVNIDHVVSENLTRVEKSKDGRPTAVHGMVLPVLGTTLFTEADVVISPSSVVIEGIQKDKVDPTIQKNIRVEYLRTDLTN